MEKIKVKEDNREYQRLSKRLIVLNTEITMGGYHDGWTLNGLKEERLNIMKRLAHIVSNKNHGTLDI